ncbi:MAG: PAS domain S-box protein [Desulfobacteraceae bacterium]|nr:PAS domain S-box protein [Desulfobacteraceae bacterium]
MKEKPAYEELEQRISDLENEKNKWQLAALSLPQDSHVMKIGADATKRNQIENAAKESEIRYRSIFHHTNDGVAVYKAVNDGQDFIFTDFNPAGEKIDGISKDKVVGKSIRQLFPAVKEFGLFDVFQRVWKTGKPEILPIAHYKDDRISGWRKNHVYKLPSGEIVAVYRDETERRQAEHSLKKAKNELEHKIKQRTAELSDANQQLTLQINERKKIEVELQNSILQWRSTFDAVSSGICLLYLDGTILKCNQAMANFLNRTISEIIGATCWKIVHNTSEPIRECPFVKMKETLRRETAILPLQDNKWIEVTVDPVLDENSDLKAGVHIITDVTERLKTESDLKMSENRYRNLFENTGTATFVVEEDMTISQVNSKCVELSGYSRQEIVGKMKPIDFVLPQDLGKIKKYHNERLKKSQGAPSEYELKLVDKYGNVKTLLIQVGLIPGTKQSIASLIDITPLKRAEEKKRKLEAHLQQSRKLEAIGVLAGGIAHEFNNALAGLAGNIELLMMHLPDHKNVLNFGEITMRLIERMTNHTNMLLAYGHGGKYLPKIVNLNDFVKDTLAIRQHDVDPKIKIETELLSDISYVKADLNQLQTVLSEVITNALEAIEQEGILKVRIKDTSISEDNDADRFNLQPGRYACLTLEDNGKGMNEETRNRIFEPFFTTKFQGRGLGMAAVYGIVKNHEGYIYIDSEFGKGTVARIFLPSVKNIEKETKRVDPEQAQDGGTILVIDDDEVILEIVHEMLKKTGYRVLCARTGKEAISIAESFEDAIDLAFLDVNLPDMEGSRIYQIIKEYRPKIKVIVCSGYSSDGPVQEILSAGAEDFIKKPFAFKEVFSKVRSVLEDKCDALE